MLAHPISVLLVDDDDQCRKFCCAMLIKNGFEVFDADNGMEALLIAGQHAFAIDLLVTDVRMPGISGADLGRAFKAVLPRLRVLYISGSSAEVVSGCLGAGCDFLPKPFSPDALFSAIGRLFDESSDSRSFVAA